MDVHNLIRQVFMRPALWDKTNKYHHNRFVLGKLWNEIAQELNTKQNAVQSKWKVLRDKFRSTLASIPEPESGDAKDSVDYMGEWKYFKSLLFLKDQFTPRQSSGNFGVTTPVSFLQDSDDEDNEIEADLGKSSELLTNGPSTYFSSKNASESGQKSPCKESVKSERPHSVIHQRKHKEIIADKLLDVEKEKLDYSKNKKQKIQDDDDEDLNFFKSLLPHIKKLQPLAKLQYRMKVMEVTHDFVKSAKSSHSKSNQDVVDEDDIIFIEENK
ncbi:hypothetical protein LSTR_LSTR002714 [Laodelphax striatellus]|uniref:MADF domain-containing protein n=1 Tax=Laodelphax striatellus TaxID=195883 RepID=A0A482X5Y4_LAOST|nr:hypothetical protein LSTR_LSTR002714 [Laodelphax striatellus]